MLIAVLVALGHAGHAPADGDIPRPRRPAPSHCGLLRPHRWCAGHSLRGGRPQQRHPAATSGSAQATVVGLALGAHIPPLILAWVLAAIVRVTMGSATVAMAVASGVLAPLAGHMGVRPEMLVLATGCGALLLSHVNDSGFWLVQSLFKMDVKGTLATWSALETVLSITGLGFTLLLASLLH